MKRKVISGSLSLSISNKKEKKFNKELEIRLERIAIENEKLCQPISKLAYGVQASEKGLEHITPIPEGMLERISNAYGVKDKNAALIMYHLGMSNYHWHTIDAVKKRTGLTASTIEEITSRKGSPICKGLSQSGNTVYGFRGTVFGFLTAPYYF